MHTHVVREYDLVRAHYINQPGHGQSEKVYIDYSDERPDWYDVFWDWIRKDQPLAYNYRETKRAHDIWKRTDGLPHTEPEVTSVCKPRPAPWWAIHVFTKTFNIGIKRVGKDICPVHSALQSKIDHLETLQPQPINEIAIIRERITKHQQRADDTYDMVHHSKSNCSSALWEENNWEMNLDETHMVHSERANHLEYDYDHSRSELEIKEQDAHYKSTECLNAVSVVHKPLGRLSFMYSEMFGGKGSDGIITASLFIMNRMSLGAAHES